MERLIQSTHTCPVQMAWPLTYGVTKTVQELFGAEFHRYAQDEFAV
jgi:hypothetical protein